MELDKLKQTLEEKAKAAVPVQTVWAEVKDVDWEEKTMVAIGIDDEVDYFDIILGVGSVYYKPKKGCSCLIGIIDNNDTTPFLIYAEELESYEVKVGETQLNMENGFLLKKENETLKKLMVDLLEAIELMKFTTNQGPTLKLINKQSFTDIKTRFKTFLKDS